MLISLQCCQHVLLYAYLNLPCILACLSRFETMDTSIHQYPPILWLHVLVANTFWYQPWVADFVWYVSLQLWLDLSIYDWYLQILSDISLYWIGGLSHLLLIPSDRVWYRRISSHLTAAADIAHPVSANIRRTVSASIHQYLTWYPALPFSILVDTGGYLFFIVRYHPIFTLVEVNRSGQKD